MGKLSEFLLFDFLSPKNCQNSQQNLDSRIKYQVTDIISIALILQNSACIIKDYFLDSYENQNQAIITGWILILMKILSFIVYKYLNKSLPKNNFQAYHTLYLTIYFILNGCFYVFYEIEGVLARKTDNLVFFWLGIKLMIWTLLIFLISNPLLKILSVGITIMSSFILYLTNTNILNFIDNLFLIFTLGIVISLTARWHQLLIDDLLMRLNEEKLYQEVLQDLPVSLVIINDQNKVPLYYNNSYQDLLKDNSLSLSDLRQVTSKIINLKIRDNKNLERRKTRFCDPAEDNNCKNDSHFLSKVTQLLSSNLKVTLLTEKIVINTVPLPSNPNELFTINNENQDLLSPQNIIKERRKLTHDVEIIRYSAFKEIDEYNSKILKNGSKTLPKSNSDPHPPIAPKFNLQSNEVTLDKIIESLINLIQKEVLFFEEERINLQGSFGDREIEIKIIKSLYKNEPCLLLIFTDMTYYNLKIKLEDNQQYKSLLLSSVSHEFKTPLNGSIALIQSSTEECDISTNSKKYLLEPALNSLKLLHSFINNMLDYSQILTNKLKLDLSTINIRQITHDVIELVKFQFIKKEDVKLIVEIDESVPYEFNTDPGRYSQILLSLIGNAFKFTFSGEIKVKLEYQPEKDMIIASVEDTGVGIPLSSVIQLKILFKSSNNYYIQEKLSKNSTGCALGLTIASALAKLLAPIENKMSCIDVESAENVGSNFAFLIENKTIIKIISQGDLVKKFDLLPEDQDLDSMQQSQERHIIWDSVVQNEPKFILKSDQNLQDIIEPKNELVKRMMSEMHYFYPSKDSLQENNSLHKYEMKYKEGLAENSANFFKILKNPLSKFSINNSKHDPKKDEAIILIVDDDAFNIHCLEMVLHSLNFKYESAYNGKYAIDKIINNPNITFVFMDCNMPVMDGWEATKILKEKMKNSEIKKIPIIACTAYCDEDNKKKCIKAGMDDILSKPVTKAKVIEILKKYSLVNIPKSTTF